jgi:hypothetical protein
MGAAGKTLVRMRENPGDWRIEMFLRLAEETREA